jgi:hypothetical protein
MPRFHFNLHDGVNHRDFVGKELSCIAQARSGAIRFSSEFLQLNTLNFWIDDEWRMDVTDHAGLILFSVNFFSIDAPALCRARVVAPLDPGSCIGDALKRRCSRRDWESRYDHEVPRSTV